MTVGVRPVHGVDVGTERLDSAVEVGRSEFGARSSLPGPTCARASKRQRYSIGYHD